MMGMAIEEREEKSVVVLEGAVDVSSAAELKTLLVQAIETGKPIRIALASAAYLDVTAVQLLWAAEKAAEQAGIDWALDGEIPPALTAQLADAGFPWFQTPAHAG